MAWLSKPRGLLPAADYNWPENRALPCHRLHLYPRVPPEGPQHPSASRSSSCFRTAMRPKTCYTSQTPGQVGGKAHGRDHWNEFRGRNKPGAARACAGSHPSEPESLSLTNQVSVDPCHTCDSGIGSVQETSWHSPDIVPTGAYRQARARQLTGRQARVSGHAVNSAGNPPNSYEAGP